MPHRSFEEVVLPHLDAAFNYARWLTKNEADAEDVVQDASVRALRFFSSLRGESSIRRLPDAVECRCGSAHEGGSTNSRKRNELTGHRLSPTRRSTFWNRRSARRGSKPGRRRTPGLNRSSNPFSSQVIA
jgi:Sigma-70 region 2